MIASAPAVWVVIPTRDEAEAIGPLLAELARAPVAGVVVADGGSTDGTAERARAAGATTLGVGPGYGRACAAGAAAAVAAGAEILVFMDGDGADDPAFLPALLAPLRSGEAALVLGARVRRLRAKGAMAWHQALAGRLAGFVLGRLYGVRMRDMCAFRALRAETLAALALRETGYGWNIEMQMRAARAGLVCREIPVPCRRRLGGRSKVAGSLPGSLRASARILLTIARIAAETRLRPARLRPG